MSWTPSDEVRAKDRIRKRLAYLPKTERGEAAERRLTEEFRRGVAMAATLCDRRADAEALTDRTRGAALRAMAAELRRKLLEDARDDRRQV